MMEFKEYQDLGTTALETFEAVKPEDEVFHSLYIAGRSRTNENGVIEKAGKMQLRGVESNLDEVYMVVTHIKTMLVKNIKDPKDINKKKLDCFCYQNATPWVGTSGRTCPTTSAVRRTERGCEECRGHIVMAGILTGSKGKPKKDATGKPIYIFIRGEGIKYNNVSTYVNECSKLDLTPIFTPVTAESNKFEKSIVNIKRFVTKITLGTATTQFGDRIVFALESALQLPDAQIPTILKISQGTLGEFHNKFDWSRKKGTDTPAGIIPASDYAETKIPVIEESVKPTTEPIKQEVSETISFDDITF
jgi:hypothetical protein